MPRRYAACLPVLLSALAQAPAMAADEQENWDIKWQSTYVAQRKPAFAAAYSGQNSLSQGREHSYSFTATAAIALRLAPNTELYLNPEIAQGVPLSGLTGLGGFPNGELARTSGPRLTLYRARSFLRHTWNLGGDEEKVEAEMNQMAASVNKRRLVFTVGTLSVQDIFDDNTYAHDPRMEFLNWALVTHGAYDFAADARGYSNGAAVEYVHDDWAFRLGRFAQPVESNGRTLDWRLFRHYGDQLEIELGYRMGDRPGKLRLLAYRNVARMARYDDALAQAARTATTPELNRVRDTERAKTGVGINVEQAVGSDLGLFARAMWADGKTETYAYTEIDRSLSFGALLTGQRWQRSDDAIGLAFARNALSSDHRRYLAQGGYGFFIGDGRLNYRPETVVEAFYRAKVHRLAWISADYQWIRNPAYNADRGPVRVATLRLHSEF